VKKIDASGCVLFGEQEGGAVVQQLILPQVKPGTVIALKGLFGAGKSTLVRALFKALGHQGGALPSPTYGYMHSYTMPSGLLVHHFDLYRCEGLEDLEELGLLDYFCNDEAVVIVEWPDVVMPFLSRVGKKVFALELEHEGVDAEIRRLRIV